MQEILTHPAVQGGVVPLLVAVIVALAFSPLRMGGLAIVAGFAACVQLTSGIQFTPLTATRKLVLLAFAAAAAGPVLDFMLKPTRFGDLLIAAAGGGASLWVFWPVLSQKPGGAAWLLGTTIAVSAAFMIGFGLKRLALDAVRAGAAALGAGLGAGIGAILAASITYGLLGIALAASAGGFLLPQMLRGKRTQAGATFTLPAMLIAALVAAGAMMLANLPWYSVLALALVPAAAAIPLPVRAPVAAQAVLAALSATAVAAVACGLAYAASRT